MPKVKKVDIPSKPTPGICHICGYKNNDAEYIKRHIARHDSANKPYKCDQCSYAASHPSMLRIHKRTHEGKRPFLCDICGAGFTHQSNCQRHKLTHQFVKRHKCQRCSYTANQRVSIRTHQDCFKDVLYACDLCAYLSCTRSLILKHMREAHGITDAYVTGLHGESVDGEDGEDEGGISYMDEENNITIHEDGENSVMKKPLKPSYVSPLQNKCLNKLDTQSSIPCPEDHQEKPSTLATVKVERASVST